MSRIAGAYRPELDGVRGLAILLVLVSHVFDVGPAGWTGVAIFFVLSGYLITRTLVRDPSIPRFYLRRAARLVPALVLTIAFALIFLGPKGVMEAALHYSNWPLANGGNLGGMGHAWSLAIEEQFYLVWPLALPFLVGRPRLVMAIAGVSIALRFALPANFGYYATFTRLDGLMLGAVLALTGWRTNLAWLGLAAVAVLSFAAQLEPLSLTAMTLAGVCLVASTPRMLIPLAPLGRISYALYLFHLPLIYAVGVPTGIALAIPLAYLSTRFLEEPIRRAVAARLQVLDDLDEQVLVGSLRGRAAVILWRP